MRFTKQLEAEVMSTLEDNYRVCVVFPEEMYRSDNQIIIHRDNMSMLLHRYLYQHLIGPLTRQQYLLGTCKTPGCMNPYHREIASRPQGNRVRTKCPNGHPYSPDNLLAQGRIVRCRTCYAQRISKTRKSGVYPRPNVCAQGHFLTEGNLYIHRDKQGRVHRRCRTCSIDKMRERRASLRNVGGWAHTNLTTTTTETTENK